MKKPDPVEQALDRLAALKNEAGGPGFVAEIKAFLKNRSNLVVAKAAKIAGQARTTELVSELVGAFHRLMKDPSKLDKGCAATTAIAGALYELDHAEPEVYLRGIHHVQMEGSFGPPVDAAAKLRAISAMALARTRHPAALEEIVPLLVDEWPEARIGAARALAVNGGPAGALLLRLKILTGESETDVLAECFSGLLATAPERSLSLITSFIDSEDIAVAEAALLALGSSRLPEALDLLKARWERTAGGPLRKIVLLAIAMIRSDAAIEFLLALLAECSPAVANDVIAGLALFRNNERVRSQVESVVARRNEKSVSEIFRQEF
ncbi:MAG TPA: HEAT repeat domain-containing protein [Candidatus Angelobacter sp.]